VGNVDGLRRHVRPRLPDLLGFRSTRAPRHVARRGTRLLKTDLIEDVLAERITPGKVFDLTTDLDGIAEAYAAMDLRRATNHWCGLVLSVDVTDMFPA
jgi:hypothetical protein